MRHQCLWCGFYRDFESMKKVIIKKKAMYVCVDCHDVTHSRYKGLKKTNPYDVYLHKPIKL